MEENQEQRNTRLTDSGEQHLVFHSLHHFVRIVQSDDILLHNLTRRLHAWTESRQTNGVAHSAIPSRKIL